MRATVGLLLVLTFGALAGAVLEGDCPACGYKIEDIYYGSGFYPYYRTELYYSATADDVLVVGFDFVGMLADRLGVPAPTGFDESKAFMDDHYAEYEELSAAWTPPENLLDLAGPDGFLPAWVEVSPELDYGYLPDEIGLIDDPYTGTHTCPRCGEPTLEFERVGFWD
ncbi:MAG: hypothetical protein NTW26_07190 [bacterium]|nr:hypothetical protein [bacterium]